MLILFVCTIEAIPQSNNSHLNTVFCGGVCQPHTQAGQVTQTKDVSFDQKEPVPPPLSWTGTPLNLLALYTVSSIFIIYILVQKKLFIRISTLRF